MTDRLDTTEPPGPVWFCKLTLKYLGRRFPPGRCWGDKPSSHTSPWGGHGGSPVLPGTHRPGRNTGSETDLKPEIFHFMCDNYM